MSGPHPLRRIVALGAAMAALGGAVVVAADGVDRGASVDETAERLVQPQGDVAVAFDRGDLDRFTAEAVGRAASSVGGVASPGRTGSLGLRAITRNGVTVHAPPSGWLIPTVYSSLPRGAIGAIMGHDVAAVLDDGSVVMNEVTAGATGAAEGDVVVMQAADGSAVSLRIAGIRPYEQIGWGELVFTTDVAARLGATADTRVVMWGFDDRTALDAALVREGVTGRPNTKVNRSWDPPDPDDTMSTARTKIALGEPWYTFGSDGGVVMHPDWKAANLTDGRVLLNSAIPIRARCHVKVVDDLKDALAEVAAAGLAGEIDVANANTYGGCYVPRFSRVSGEIGFLSRHTYGMALDTNTTSNCNGCRPRMHCDVVRIFRKHGFAWGGNFRTPDGMHFEWVGERRDQIAYPSPYCPNVVTEGSERLTEGSSATLGLGALHAGDSSAHHDHPHQ